MGILKMIIGTVVSIVSFLIALKLLAFILGLFSILVGLVKLAFIIAIVAVIAWIVYKIVAPRNAAQV